MQRKLDRIRERAGLLSVKDSWKNAKNPIVSYEGNGGLNGKLTEIVRQERGIRDNRAGTSTNIRLLY